MARNYYQYKKGGFTLHPSTYRSIAWKVRQYPMFIDEIAKINAKSPLKITQKDSINRVAMEEQLSIMEKALEKYVPYELREPVKEHCFYAVEYEDLVDKYSWSRSSIARAVQMYIWGVAQEYGEDFKN